MFFLLKQKASVYRGFLQRYPTGSTTQIGFFYLLVIGKLGSRTRHRDAAGFQHVRTACNFKRELRVLFDQRTVTPKRLRPE
jgi:hypothetical protein